MLSAETFGRSPVLSSVTCSRVSSPATSTKRVRSCHRLNYSSYKQSFHHNSPKQICTHSTYTGDSFQQLYASPKSQIYFYSSDVSPHLRESSVNYNERIDPSYQIILRADVIENESTPSSLRIKKIPLCCDVNYNVSAFYNI